MKFKELISHLDEQFPRSLSLPDDPDGVDVCVDHDLEIGRILVVLDVTLEAIDYAITHGYNCIISHHSMMYSPVKKLDLSDITSKKAVMLARHDICAASFHTRLDAVDGGVNDCLLKAAGIAGTVGPLYEGEVPIGRVTTLDEEIDLRDLACNIKKSMINYYKNNFSHDININVNYFKGSGKAKKIGTVCGGGISFGELAVKANADTFFTGEGKYHDIIGGSESFGMSIITAGHFETEAVVLPFVKQKILEKFPEAKADCFIGENLIYYI